MSVTDNLRDLHKQATTEKSHHYVGKVVQSAIAEIQMLRAHLEHALEAASETDPGCEECREAKRFLRATRGKGAVIPHGD